MPFRDKVDNGKGSVSMSLQVTIDALRREVSRFEGVRDSAMQSAANEEERERVRVALQAEVNKAQAQLAAEIFKQQEALEDERG